MVRLDNTVPIKGVGREVTSSFVKRNGDLCLYQRSDGPYEVFYVKQLKAENLFGRDYPDREAYPSNEDFGSIAWCFTDFDKAMERFNKEL